MGVKFPASVAAQFARAASAAIKLKKPIGGPIRLTVVCAVLLSIVVVSGSSYFLFNLHNRIRTVNERDLSNIALVLAKCLDLDRFKEVNDVYGYLIGDGLLCEAARRLQTAATGAFLARVGGDGFTLVVTNGPQPETAKALGERLLAAFRDDFEIDGHRIQIGLSIGGAVYPSDGTDAKELLANADAALYQAKAEMRGSMRLFDAEIGTARAARLAERSAGRF
jgi:diguanylate cyclase (GGDEF)-like protein